ERGPLDVAITTEKALYLPFSERIVDLLPRSRGRPGRLAGRRLAIEAPFLHEVVHRLIEAPLTGVQLHVHRDAGGAVAHQPQHLPEPRRRVVVEPGTEEHLLTVEGPPLDIDAVLMPASNLVGVLPRDRELEEMARDPFVPEDRARIGDSGADVEVG